MSNGAKGLFVVLALVVVLGVFCNGVISLVKPQKIDPSQQSIQMVQPCGWFWCANYDSHYAEHVNLPNSQANQNNGQANVYNARATAIVSQSRDYQAQQSTGDLALGGMMGCVIGLALFLLIGGGLVSIFNK